MPIDAAKDVRKNTSLHGLLAKCKAEKLTYLSMVLFSVMFAGLGLPMDLKPIWGTDITAHYVLAYLSVAPFLFSSTVYAYLNRKTLLESPWIIALPLAFLAIEPLKAHGVLASGVAQRALLACIFIWVALVCNQKQASNRKYR